VPEPVLKIKKLAIPNELSEMILRSKKDNFRPLSTLSFYSYRTDSRSRTLLRTFLWLLDADPIIDWRGSLGLG